MKKESQKLIIKLKPEDLNNLSIDTKQSHYNSNTMSKLKKLEAPMLDTINLNTN